MRPLGSLLPVIFQAVAAGNTPDCIENTGGTCPMDGIAADCHAWRGETTCDASRCFCQEGLCAGSDEVCYNPEEKPYVKIGDSQEYEIRNSRWPTYHMYCSMMGAVAVSEDTDDKSVFTLVRPPSSNADTFLLYSKHYPDSTIYVTDPDLKKRQTTCGRITGGMFGLMGDPSIAEIGLRLFIAPNDAPDENHTLIMFESSYYQGDYLYVGTMSWDVAPWEGDPGAGGYWYFHPPLPADFVQTLPRYTGRRCTSHCGEAKKNPVLTSMAWGCGLSLATGAVLAAVSLLCHGV